MEILSVLAIPCSTYRHLIRHFTWYSQTIDAYSFWTSSTKSQHSTTTEGNRICVYLMNVYLTGVHPMRIHFISVCLRGVYLTGMCLIGLYLMGVHLMYLTRVYVRGIHLIGVHHRIQPFLLSRTYVFAAFGGRWPGVAFLNFGN